MGLRAQAELDLGQSLESEADWGVSFTLTNPAGFSGTEALFGGSQDIGQLIDPDTGQGVSGRHATLQARISSLEAAGFTDLPIAIADKTSLPWVVGFAGLNFKVKESRPDRSLGVVSLILEFYRADL